MSVCHVNVDNRIETEYGVVLKDPAVHIVAEEDLFVRFGELGVLSKKAELETSALLKSNLKVPVQTVMSLSGLQPDMACYVIRRMIEHTASGFVKSFYEKCNDVDYLEWLKNERLRVPINVFK